MNRKQRRAGKKQDLAPADPRAPGTVKSGAVAVPPGRSWDVKDVLADALRQHQAGHLPDAERLYRQVLQVDPRNADALHLLGVVAHQVGRNDVSAELIRKAIEINGNDAAFHSNLGVTLKDWGHFGDAVVSYRTALRIKPDCAEAYANLGITLKASDRLDDAVAVYRAALIIKPDCAEVHSNLGNALKDLGRLDAAAAAYATALRIKPDFAEAHYNRGNALYTLGRLDDAVVAYKAALGIKPNYTEVHSNMGNAMKDLDRLDEAVAAYATALRINPDFAEAHSNLGNVLTGLGHLESAVAVCCAALAIKPNHAETLLNRGNAFYEMGRFDNALAAYGAALRIKPDYAEAYSNLGNALKDLGRLAEAVTAYGDALRIKPDFAEAHYNLGNALYDLGRFDDAIICFRAALGAKPDYAKALNNLAALHTGQGNFGTALTLTIRSIRIKETKEAKRIFVDCAQGVNWQYDDSEIRTAMVRALTEAWDRPIQLAQSAFRLAKLNPDLSVVMTRAVAAWPQRLCAQALFDTAGVAALAADPLLHALLTSTPICDIEMERFLTMVRRTMLDAAAGMTLIDGGAVAALDFYSALARQCFINEYVFSYTDDEIAKASELRDSLSAALAAKAQIPALWPVTVAAYFPLCSLSLASQLLNTTWPDVVTAVLKEQICETEEERRLQATIPRLTVIEDDVSRLVQNQYEENPYPRWIRLATDAKPLDVDTALRRMFPLATFNLLKKYDTPDILIAGCGTGQHSIGTALRFRGARILAVDLSMASLCYAKRKTQEMGLTSIEYAQADLLRLAEIDRHFDVIESAGVLHHLADPLAGWRALLSLLRPGGLMRLGLYSEVARRNIAKARTLISKHGYGSTADDIRQCRQFLANNDSDVEIKLVTELYDYFSTSNCRDLILHVSEHLMTIEILRDFIKDNNLRFIGFELNNISMVGYRRRFPNDPTATDLEQWSIFEKENPDTFLGMYQFWVKKMT